MLISLKKGGQCKETYFRYEITLAPSWRAHDLLVYPDLPLRVTLSLGKYAPDLNCEICNKD